MRRVWVWRLAMLGLVLGLGLWGWMRLNQPLGEQRVSFAPAVAQCGSHGALRYCIYRSAGSRNRDLVYHLHGRRLDEQAWNDASYYTAMLQAEWQRNGAEAPVVVALSYGPTWLLAPRNAAPDSGLLDDLRAALPALEARLKLGGGRRMLLGESMGGLNVLILGLSAPASFDRIAALCPGVYRDSPFADWRTLKAAAVRTGVDPKLALAILHLAHRHADDAQSWRRMDPLALIEAADPRFPALYLSVGLYDRYGNFEGTQALAEQAQRRGVRLEWHPIYGGHCASDIESLARFLIG